MKANALKVLVLWTAMFAASASPAGSVTEAGVKAFLVSMDQAIHARDVDGVARLLSPDFKATAEITIQGQKHVQSMSRGEYLMALRSAWAGLEHYDYKRTEERVSIAADGSSATVTAMVRETLTMRGQSMTSVAREIATLRPFEGRLLLAQVVARQQ